MNNNQRIINSEEVKEAMLKIVAEEFRILK